MANYTPTLSLVNNHLATPYGEYRFHKLFNIQNEGSLNYEYYGDVDVCLDLYGQDWDRNIGIFKYTIKVQSYSRLPFTANGVRVSCNDYVIYQTDKVIHFTDDKQLLAEGFVQIPADASGNFVLEPLYFTTRVGTSETETSYFPFNNSPYPQDKIKAMQKSPFLLPTGDWRTVVEVRPSNASPNNYTNFIYKYFYVEETVNSPFQLAIPWIPENAARLRVFLTEDATADDVNLRNIIWDSYIDNPRAGETYDVNLEFPLESRIKIYEVIRNQHAANPYPETNVDAAVNMTICVAYLNADGEEITVATHGNLFDIAVETTKPIVKGNVYDINPITTALTGNDTVIVRYASHAYAEIDAQVTVASIVETGITNGGESAINVLHHTFTSPQYPTFEFYALDAANLFGYDTVNTPFIEYIVPTAKISASNITGEGDVNFSVSGNIFVGSFGVQENDIKIYYRYKQKGSETVYCDWVEMPNIQVDAETNKYVVESSLSGLDYTRTYMFQAKIVDKVQERLSVEYEAIARPIFDWSANDFNFNVPVTIMGNPVLTGAADNSAGNTILWEGESGMYGTDIIQLSQPISQQKTGIILVFDSIGTTASYTTHFVPKAMLNYYAGRTHVFFMTANAKVGKAYVGAKELYINDTNIKGHPNNQTSSEVPNDYITSQIKHNNMVFRLIAVIGV